MSCPQNHGISSHWWPLEIQKNPALQSQHPSFLEGPMILRVWKFSLQSFLAALRCLSPRSVSLLVAIFWMGIFQNAHTTKDSLVYRNPLKIWHQWRLVDICLFAQFWWDMTHYICPEDGIFGIWRVRGHNKHDSPEFTNMTLKKSTIWRCISYQKWWFSNVMLVFGGVINQVKCNPCGIAPG